MAVKRTQMRALYVALKQLKQSELVALGKAHAENPSMLFHRIRADLKTVSDYPALGDHPLAGAKRKDLPPHVKPTRVTTTPEFASILAVAPGPCQVGEDTSLAFTYLDRELHPLRGLATAAGVEESRVERRYLDLLLRSDDATPILSELKIKTDSLPYSALIQLLMHTVELSGAAQRRRLSAAFPSLSSKGPVDLYVLSYGEPNKTFDRVSRISAQEIASALVCDPRSPLRGSVRRIAFVKASGTSKTLSFTPLFVAQ